MKNRKQSIAIGFIAIIVLLFAFVACDNGTKDETGNDDLSEGTTMPPPSINGVKLYKLSGTTFSEYSGTGSAQDIIGNVRQLGGGSSSNTIGKIGTISGDGKLNLQLPTTISDDKLFDYSLNGETFKLVALATSPSISLYRNDGEYFGIMYVHSVGQKGWLITNQDILVTDISNYKWVID